MKVLQIKELIEKGKSIIFYNKDVKQCYDELKGDYLCIYFDEPAPSKVRLIEIVDKLKNGKKFKKNISIPELKKLIIDELEDNRLIIIFNNFENLNTQSASPYYALNENENIQFICSFKNKFKKQIFPFYQKFELINKDKYKNECRNEINITYVNYFIISFLCFLIYMKITSSVYMAVMLLGGIWFALMIFKTLMYAGGRI